MHKPLTRYVEHYGAVVSMLVYAGLALRLVPRQGPRPWRRWGLVGLLCFYAAAALDPLVNAAYLPAGAPKFYLTSLVLPVFAYALALWGWWAGRGEGAASLAVPEEAGSQTLAATAVATSSSASARQPPPASDGLAEVDPQQLALVVAALEQNQLFHDPELTLDSLAQAVGLTPNTVSFLLNTGLGQSFSDVVNGYRLAEVKQRLLTADARRLTVLALALEAGFNSKTTFNRVFKEKTGLTPKAYQKKYQVTQWDDSVPAAG